MTNNITLDPKSKDFFLDLCKMYSDIYSNFSTDSDGALNLIADGSRSLDRFMDDITRAKKSVVHTIDHRRDLSRDFTMDEGDRNNLVSLLDRADAMISNSLDPKIDTGKKLQGFYHCLSSNLSRIYSPGSFLVTYGRTIITCIADLLEIPDLPKAISLDHLDDLTAFTANLTSREINRTVHSGPIHYSPPMD